MLILNDAFYRDSEDNAFDIFSLYFAWLENYTNKTFYNGLVSLLCMMSDII